MRSLPARSTLAAAQCVVILLGLLALSLRPPEAGRMLLLPLFPHDGGAALRLALAHDALLIAPGPLPGSVVVQADRAGLAAVAWSHGMLATAAPPAACDAAFPAAAA